LLIFVVVLGGVLYCALLPWTNARRFIKAVRTGSTQSRTDISRSLHLTGFHALVVQSRSPMRVEPVSLRAIMAGEASISSELPEEWKSTQVRTTFKATRSGIEAAPIVY
jgi:hypothetical protein